MEGNIKEMIASIVRAEIGDGLSFSIARQEVLGRGDYSTNAAFALAKRDRRSPLVCAEDLAARLHEKHQDIFYAIEVAPPGFLNFFLAHPFIHTELTRVTRLSKRKKSTGKASVEFISANPTGPLHVGNARGGPIGDTIAHVLSEVGYRVTREYLHNDAGAQIAKFTDSLWHWYLKAQRARSTLSENGYEGEYVKEIARDAYKKWKARLRKNPKGKDVLTRFALARFWKENFATIKKMGITFDSITKESVIAKTQTKKVLRELEVRGLLKKKEGAVWFVPNRVKGFDKEVKDAVVVKADGTFLYFANDIAYHKEKFSHNDIVIDVLGEGHEGHIPKLRAIAEVFGFSNEHFSVVVHGQVHLLKKGKIVTMSKRKGNFVTAAEVLNDVGRDAFRFFMLQYTPRSGMQFDLALAKERSKKNPVYYVQYAHARASSILRKAQMTEVPLPSFEELESLPELALMKQILAYREVVDDTARDFEVARLTRYAYELARAFTNFYETTPVLANLDAGRPSLKKERLMLVLITKKMLARTLGLLGISAPEKM